MGTEITRYRCILSANELERSGTRPIRPDLSSKDLGVRIGILDKNKVSKTPERSPELDQQLQRYGFSVTTRQLDPDKLEQALRSDPPPYFRVRPMDFGWDAPDHWLSNMFRVVNARTTPWHLSTVVALYHPVLDLTKGVDAAQESLARWLNGLKEEGNQGIQGVHRNRLARIIERTEEVARASQPAGFPERLDFYLQVLAKMALSTDERSELDKTLRALPMNLMASCYNNMVRFNTRQPAGAEFNLGVPVTFEARISDGHPLSRSYMLGQVGVGEEE